MLIGKKRDSVKSFVMHSSSDCHFWSNQIDTAVVNTWMGLAFERVCLLHIEQIKKKLGIQGVLTNINSRYCKGNPDKGVMGSQIDLLIVRKDQVINLCEMKYSKAKYSVSADLIADINRKISDLKIATGTKYAIHPTLITTYGLAENSYSGNIQSTVTLEDLFSSL